MTTTFTGMVRIPGAIENGLPSTITLDPHMLVLTAGGTELGRWNRSELELRREPDGSFHLTLGREVVLFNPDSPLEFAILSGMPGAGTAPAAPPAAPAAPPATATAPPMTTPPAPAPVAPVTPMQASQDAPPTPAPAAAEYSEPPSAPAAPSIPPSAAPPVAPAVPAQASPAAPPPSPSMPPPAAMPPPSPSMPPPAAMPPSQPAAPPVAPPAVDPMTSPVAPAPSTAMADSLPLPPQTPPAAPPATPAPEPMAQPQPMTPPMTPAAGMEPAGTGLAAPQPAAAAPVAFELEQQQEPAEPPGAAEPEAPRSNNFWDAFYADEREAQMAPADGLIATATDDDPPAIPGFHLDDDHPAEDAGPRAPRLGGYGSGLFTEEDDAPAFAPAFTAGNDDESDERTWSFYDEDEEAGEERSWSYDDDSIGSKAAVEDSEPPEHRAAANDREELVTASDGSRLGAILGAVKGWRPGVPSLSFGSSGLGIRAREAVSVLDAILEENGTEDIPRSFILGLGGFAALLALVAVLVVLFG